VCVRVCVFSRGICLSVSVACICVYVCVCAVCVRFCVGMCVFCGFVRLISNLQRDILPMGIVRAPGARDNTDRYGI